MGRVRYYLSVIEPYKTTKTLLDPKDNKEKKINFYDKQYIYPYQEILNYISRKFSNISILKEEESLYGNKNEIELWYKRENNDKGYEKELDYIENLAELVSKNYYKKDKLPIGILLSKHNMLFACTITEDEEFFHGECYYKKYYDYASSPMFMAESIDN